MKEIERYDINEAWAHSGIIKAGDFCFLNYCVRNVDGAIEQQINGAFDEMEERLALVGMTLENVVQMNCLFKNIYDIPIMEKVIKERFNGNTLYASRFKPNLQIKIIDCYFKLML